MWAFQTLFSTKANHFEGRPPPTPDCTGCSYLTAASIQHCCKSGSIPTAGTGYWLYNAHDKCSAIWFYRSFSDSSSDCHLNGAFYIPGSAGDQTECELTWSCPWCCADGGQWWGLCTGKTLYGWCSGSGCLSPGRRLPWLHPGLISETSSTGHVPDTRAASVPHCKRRNLLRKSGKDGNDQLRRAKTLRPAGKNTLPKMTWVRIWVILFLWATGWKIEKELSTIMAIITYTRMCRRVTDQQYFSQYCK